MQSAIYAVAFAQDEAGGALGRLAIRELKAGERADLLRHVADVRRYGLDRALLKEIKNKAVALSENATWWHTAFGHATKRSDGSLVRREAPGQKTTPKVEGGNEASNPRASP